MKHSFFEEISNDSELADYCNLDITTLPEAHIPTNPIKAIVLGADPTNNGPAGEGLIELNKVFGIGSHFESNFWLAQRQNLEAIGLTSDDVYVQNVCRNYFKAETYKNKFWMVIAKKYWLKYLKEELDKLDEQIPVLVTTEVICKLLVGDKIPAAKVIYSNKDFSPFKSEYLQRDVYPLYRNFNYYLTTDKWKDYKQILIDKFK